ncbi:hypothetical protein EDB80DRAFT_877270 [Ilyonectria destructans]|nr:hypothetical protein EDB80DRAFT_877270 [Ilyonectria destructans]
MRVARQDKADQEDIDESVVGLTARLKAGVSGAFASLHMGFFSYSTLLYYLHLDGQRPTPAMTPNFADQCKTLALSQSNLLRRFRAPGNCELLFSGVGRTAVVSSLVLLHTYLRGGEILVAMAKDGLDSNFRVLTELRQYWPSIEMVVRRLDIFQDACTEAAATQGYKFRSWVVKPLLEIHRPSKWDVYYVSTLMVS